MVGRGTGKKAHDLMVCPLCSEGGNRCHQVIENHEDYRHEDEWTRKMMHSDLMFCYISQTLIAGYEAGVIKL